MSPILHSVSRLAERLGMRALLVRWDTPLARRSLAAAAKAFLLSRIVVYGAVLLGPFFLPERSYPDLPDVTFRTATPWPVDALVRWDGIHYLSVALQGYQVSPSNWGTNMPFLPLYPWLARLLGGWAGETGPVYAGLVLSNLALFAALVLLYRTAEERFGPAVAERSALYLAVFPTAFFFSAFYAESLFLLLVLAFFVALRKENWLLAGAFGGLATLTRIPAILLVAVYLWKYLTIHGHSWGRKSWPLLAGGLIPAGMLLFMGVMWLQVGDPFSFFDSHRLWGRRPGTPLDQLALTAAALTEGGLQLPGFGLVFPVAIVVLFLMAGVRGVASQAGEYRLWFWLYFVLALAMPAETPFYSVIRFMLGAFPGFIAMAEWGRHGAFHWVYVTSSLFFLALSTVLFSRWWWVA